MNKIYAVSSLAAALTLALPSPVTGQRLLPGYRYDHSTAPTGKEWQSPADYALGKEQPHAYFFSFAPKDRAERVLPEYSSLYQSLDGTWRFTGCARQKSALWTSIVPTTMPPLGMKSLYR